MIRGTINLVKYYLRSWYKLQENISNLSSLEIVEAKILYASLNELDEQEIELLADKYVNETIIKDETLAKQNNLSLGEYRYKRGKIERDLVPIIVENIKLYKEERTQAINLEYSK